MTDSERSKVLEEQADFLHREAESLKSLVPTRYSRVSISLSPDDLKARADKLEAISST